jgi:hypothetical protein
MPCLPKWGTGIHALSAVVTASRSYPCSRLPCNPRLTVISDNQLYFSIGAPLNILALRVFHPIFG